MKTRPLIGIIAGGISIAFSSLCIVVTPVFGAAIVLAVIGGLIGGTIALVLKARRTALVAFIFALTPLLFFLALAYDGNGDSYLVLLPVAVAIAAAVMVLFDFLGKRRVAHRN